MKTRSRILLLIVSKFATKYRNIFWLLHNLLLNICIDFLYVIYDASQKDIVNIEVFSWCVVQQILC